MVAQHNGSCQSGRVGDIFVCVCMCFFVLFFLFFVSFSSFFLFFLLAVSEHEDWMQSNVYN